jgi:hypothetical protein
VADRCTNRAPFAALAEVVEQSVHGTDRAEVDARGEQLGVDLGGWLVEEARAVEHL